MTMSAADDKLYNVKLKMDKFTEKGTKRVTKVVKFKKFDHCEGYTHKTQHSVVI